MGSEQSFEDCYDIENHEKFNETGQAKVYLCFRKIDRLKFVVKKLELKTKEGKSQDKKMIKEYERESELLKKGSHANILFQVDYFRSKEAIHIVLEPARADLLQYLNLKKKSKRGLTEPEILSITL